MHRYLKLSGALGILLLIVLAVLSGESPDQVPKGEAQEDPPARTASTLECDPPGLTPMSSGAASEMELPWLTDPEFEESISRHNTPMLMAAFRGVLTDTVGSEAFNIELAADRLSGTVVPPGAVFSQNRTLGPYDEGNGYRPGPNYVGGRMVLGTGGGVCKIATMLYNLTILSNLPVESRRAHSMIVPYVPPGQDATVSYWSSVDYRFRNSTSHPILIWARKTGNIIYMAFYGRTKPPRVVWRHETLSHRKAPTIVRFSPKLAPGEEREVEPAFDGYVVRSWAEVTYADGRVEQRNLGVSTYRVSPRIVERGPAR